MTRRSLVAWTSDEDARLRALAGEGRTAAVIAERLKRSVYAVRKRAQKFRAPLKRVTKRKQA